MKLYQPVMFVGLGGTGCDIGAELERRMREEICGPDGNDFRRTRTGSTLLPYQLPSCVQFVYADVNQAELDRLPARVAPGDHAAAVPPTAHYVRDLVPQVDSYPELARNLRMEVPRVVAPWLPPAEGEPRVNPLHRGAGQFPTIGRAALFGTFMDGITPATRNLHTAIGNLASSGEDLHALGGRPPRGVDVFVAFSVAGGTGSGIFYDYLHLIGHTLRQNTQLRVKIYPLVLMPSAFAPGLGGGRAAELNAGRALLDLFRLVDEQNSGDAERELPSEHDRGPVDPEAPAVYYPRNLRIVLRPGVVETGFLFSQPAGATREDMHRAIVSLIMSLVGTEMSHDDGSHPGELHQSFADSFVNQAAYRQVSAENGIGKRGVSTALVASMTVPVDELAGVVGARLLRTAIEQLENPAPNVESNRADIEEFLVKSGLHPVLQRHGTDINEPEAGHGARQVTAALNDRRDAMRAGIANLKAKLGRDVPELVGHFDPGHGARELLGKMDVFRVQRVVSGHPGLETEVEQRGAAGILQHRRAAPATSRGYGAMPPPVPELRDRLLGQRKVGWHHEEPVAARQEQDEWYDWATKGAWAESWARHYPQWRGPLERTQAQLNALTKALSDFARHDHEDFGRRSADLYRRRVGVSYLLPAGAGKMEQFYQQVIRRLLEYQVRDGRLKANSREADLLQTMIGGDVWREAYRLSTEEEPDHAVSYLREQVKTQVKTFLREPPTSEQLILPKLADLLVQVAAGTRSGDMQEYLDEFSGKLAGLLPANFTPQGSGPLKVLVSYPADAKSEIIERHLHSSISLPAGPAITFDYRNTHTESISVVLFRTAMGVTEVGEVRDVLRLWAGALARPEPTDLLRWRQRTGYDFGYLATREEHRVEILHRLLCALWNGRASVQGDKTSPERIRVMLEGEVALTLSLTQLGQASSWASLLRAYELWALDDDDIRRRFCAQLMRELPHGLDGNPARPHDLYLVLKDLAEEQIACLDDMAQQSVGPSSRVAQMRGFWADTLPAALSRPFRDADWAIAPSLRELEKAARG